MKISWDIRKQYAALRKSEKAAADYMLQREDQIETMILAEVAEGAGVSQPTVMRFLKAVGYDSFGEAKIAFAAQRAQKETESQSKRLYGIALNPGDSIEDIPSRVIGNTIAMLEDSLKRISSNQLQKAVQAIVQADRVSIYSVENSNTTANDLLTKMLYLGINCSHQPDYYLQRISAGNTKPGDVAIGISYTGYSRNTVDVMKLAKQKGATTIAITNCTHTPLTEQADIRIETSSQQYMYGDAIFSRTTHLAVVDMIYTGILLSDYERYTQQMDSNTQLIHTQSYENNK